MSKFRSLQLAHLGDQMASVELEREGGLWESVQSPDRNGLEDIHHAPFLPTNATAPQCPPLAILDIRNPNELHCPVSVTGCANEALHYTEVHISLRGVS